MKKHKQINCTETETIHFLDLKRALDNQFSVGLSDRIQAGTWSILTIIIRHEVWDNIVTQTAREFPKDNL